MGEVTLKSKCVDCGCPLEAKSRSLTDKCPKEKWLNKQVPK
jgi:hypothetical protein